MFEQSGDFGSNVSGLKNTQIQFLKVLVLVSRLVVLVSSKGLDLETRC